MTANLTTLEKILAASGCFSDETIHGWTLDLTLTLPLAAFALLYGGGVLRLWRRAGRGRGARIWQIACFASGWLILALALLSPLHAASRSVFTAHMIEHELLMAVAAPLLVMARPLGPMLWALPQPWRIWLGSLPKRPLFQAFWEPLTDPLFATVLHGVAIWLWHVPQLFDAALTVEPIHWLQHFSFLSSALLFWWALFFGRRGRHGYGAAVGHLFATAGHTGLLGLLLVLSPRIWYPMQGIGSAGWSLTPLEDQQLAGLVMWIPAGLVYAGAALACAGLWIATSGGRSGGSHAATPG